MLGHVLFLLLLLVSAGLFALLEIQVEGVEGWAEELPTWRTRNRWTRLVLGTRPLTGYHLYAFPFVGVLAHVPCGLGVRGSLWTLELRILAFLALFWVLEDFFWFVLNPDYGLRGFRPERAWWHAEHWWGIMPRGCWIGIPLGVGLYAASGWV